jgi:ribonuclease BN (tRNA processing enzyme)
MYNFTFIGTASAFYDMDDNFQSNLLIQSPNKKKLLIDCGGDARRALRKMDLDHTSIDGVFITHLHSDHVGGLEWLAFKRFFSTSSTLPNLYCPKNLIVPLWENSLKGGLSSLEQKTSLSTYFNVITCTENTSFKWEGLTLTPILSYHAPNENDMMPAYSLIIETPKNTIFYTSDSQFTPAYHQEIFKKSDIIFHDCETSSIKSGVHAHYDELKTLPDDIKSKIRLFHYQHKIVKDPSIDGFHSFMDPCQDILVE